VLRARALVRGVVQGVGFRPFVYRLAAEEGLAGSIGNDTEGVTIEIEGPLERIEVFLSRLRRETPPLARIDSVTLHEIDPIGERAAFVLSQAKLKVKSRLASPPTPRLAPTASASSSTQ